MSASDALPTPGNSQARFQTTHWSIVLAVAGGNLSPAAEAALETLCKTYWYPAYAFVRRQGIDPHTAEDLTQGFFLHLIKRQDFSSVRREKGRFRSFLLVALKHFLLNEWERARRQKRGGGHQVIPLDALVAEARLADEPATESNVEKAFDRRWALAMLEQVLGMLREEFAASGRIKLFEALKPFLTAGGPVKSQAELAAELDLNENAIKQAVFRIRQRYRELLRQEVTRTVAHPGDAEDELRHLISALRD